MRSFLFFVVSIMLLFGGRFVVAQDLDAIGRNAASGNIELERRALVDIRNIRSADASRIAVPLLRDNDEVVRASASGAVIYLPPSEAAAALVPLLSDKAEFVRQEAAYALGDVRDPSSVLALVRTIQKDTDPVRNAAIVAVGKIGDVGAVNVLTNVLGKNPNEDNEFMLRSAARSLGQIAEFQRTGRMSVTTPQDYLPTKFKEQPTAAAPLTAFSSSEKVLIAVLQNSKQSDDTRREAAFALGAIGDRTAVPALRSHLNSPDNHLREICKEALIKLGEQQ